MFFLDIARKKRAEAQPPSENTCNLAIPATYLPRFTPLIHLTAVPLGPNYTPYSSPLPRHHQHSQLTNAHSRDRTS